MTVSYQGQHIERHALNLDGSRQWDPDCVACLDHYCGCWGPVGDCGPRSYCHYHDGVAVRGCAGCAEDAAWLYGAV